MGLKRSRVAWMTLLILLCWGQIVQASSRWDILRWCTSTTLDEAARCEGFLLAALDLRTSDDFPGKKSCFLASTRLPHVREKVVLWLKENIIVPERSGLALVSRAVKEQYPCPD